VTDTHRTGQLWEDKPEAPWRRYVIADVFTAVPLEGNQLAVFPDGRELGSDVMQRTARELNLSETVFFLPAEDSADVRLRIFAPAGELYFAGHPVLGSAFVLGEGGLDWKTRIFAPHHGVPEDPATGSTAGLLAVHLARHGRIGFADEIEIRQGQEIGRPSRLYAQAEGPADKVERVLVGGSAVIVARGEYRLS